MGVPGRRTVDRGGYQDYIRSSAWRKTRERYWQSGLPKDCYCCDSPRRSGFHLHHRTYKNLGNERLMDLVPVCPRCHEEVHALYDSNQRWRSRGLWFATKEIRRRNSLR